MDSTGRAARRFEYDSAGNVICEILPNGSRYAYGRDSFGKITSITHSSDIGEENSTQKIYFDGLLTEVKSGNNIVHYSYDEKRRIKSIDLNDAEDYLNFTYNDSSSIETVSDASSSETTVHPAKETITTIGKTEDESQTGFSNLVSYDKLCTKTSKVYNDIEKSVITINDESNGTKTLTDNEGKSVVSSFDRNTRLLTAINPSESNDVDANESFEYYESGKLKTKTVNNITYTYTYSNTLDKKIESITTGGITVKPAFDVAGRSIGKKLTKDNGIPFIEEQISYLKFGDRATNLPGTIKYGDNTDGTFAMRDTLKYKYDVMGNITEVFENGLTAVRYEYDSLGRLKREDNRAFGKTTVFSYDDNGNILAKHIYAFTMKDTNELKELTPEDTISYTYDNDSDRLLSYDNEQCIYDSIGNPTTYRGKTVAWEFGRELVAYDGNTFAYDARGRRISKNDISFVYDHTGKLIKQYRTNTETSEISDILEFIYDHTGIFAFKYDNSTYFYRKNAQNDIIALLDNTGTVVVKYTYNAWGECITTVVDSTCEAIANLNPFRYRSYYFDTETNLYFLKTRYYDPVVGRFITIDDTSYLAPDTINGLNLYAYCGNNPVMRVDPNGNFFSFFTGIASILNTWFVVGNAGAVVSSNIAVSNQDIPPMDKERFDAILKAKDTSNLTREEQIAFVRRQREVWAEDEELSYLLDEWSEADMLREIAYHDRAYRALDAWGLGKTDLAERAKKVDFESTQNWLTYTLRSIGNMLFG